MCAALGVARFTGARVLTWDEARGQLWSSPEPVASVIAFARRAAGARRSLLVVAEGCDWDRREPDPARALLDQLAGGELPDGRLDPFLAAWRQSRDVRAMIELLDAGARRGLYELDARAMTSKSGQATRWSFRLRLPDKRFVRVDVDRDGGAMALRAVVPHLAPRAQWLEATLAQHDAIADPIAQLVYALTTLGGVRPDWRERWVSAGGSLQAAWDRTESDHAMCAILERAGRPELLARARAAMETVPLPLPGHAGCDQFHFPTPAEEAERERLHAAVQRARAEAIRLTVPVPPTLDEISRRVS